VAGKGSNYAYVALLGYGFAIVDLSDPANPKTVSTTPAASPHPPVQPPLVPLYNKYTADIKVDRTGDWVFLAMELSTTPGLLIYDARDKANPKLAGIWIAPGSFLGCHMVTYGVIDGREYLFCAPLDGTIHVGLLLPPTPAGVREVVHVAMISLHNAKSLQQHAAQPTRMLSGHDDMTLQPDPLTGTPTLFVSAWNLGVRVVDVSVPAAPRELGAWMGEGATHYRGLIHTTMAFKSDDGRRIIVTIPEVANPPTLFVLDATNLANIRAIAEWRAVEDFGREPYTFSMHNFQIVDQKAYLAMYHGGIWVFDLRTPEKPTPVGSYMPAEARHDGKPYQVGAWDVVVWHGYTLTADGHGGFYVLHLDGDPAGDKAYTSFA
jgi:hypothetical protein